MNGKTALVTGGARGIGRAIVLKLASQGTNVIINYFRNGDTARETVELATSLGVEAHSFKANVGDPKKIKQMFDWVRDEIGYLDILVNNAASGIQRPVLDINARGPLLCSKEAAPLMDGRGGRIVNISSLGSTRVMADYAAVGVSKAALEALTRYLAVELAPKGIVVNAVSGGLVSTGALEHFPKRDQMLNKAKQETPAGRLVTEDDLAQVVAFLCSDAADMIIGQTIIVDGGMSHYWATALGSDNA